MVPYWKITTTIFLPGHWERHNVLWHLQKVPNFILFLCCHEMFVEFHDSSILKVSGQLCGGINGKSGSVECFGDGWKAGYIMADFE